MYQSLKKHFNEILLYQVDSNHKNRLHSKAKSKKCRYIQGASGMQINRANGIPHANMHMLCIPLVMPEDERSYTDVYMDVTFHLICPFIERFVSSMLRFREKKKKKKSVKIHIKSIRIQSENSQKKSYFVSSSVGAVTVFCLFRAVF